MQENIEMYTRQGACPEHMAEFLRRGLLFMRTWNLTGGDLPPVTYPDACDLPCITSEIEEYLLEDLLAGNPECVEWLADLTGWDVPEIRAAYAVAATK